MTKEKIKDSIITYFLELKKNKYWDEDEVDEEKAAEDFLCHPENFTPEARKKILKIIKEVTLKIRKINSIKANALIFKYDNRKRIRKYCRRIINGKM